MLDMRVGNIVTFKWADDMGDPPRRTGIVLTVLDDTAPEGVEVMWDTGEIDWDYSDNLDLIASSDNAS